MLLHGSCGHVAHDVMRPFELLSWVLVRQPVDVENKLRVQGVGIGDTFLQVLEKPVPFQYCFNVRVMYLVFRMNCFHSESSMATAYHESGHDGTHACKKIPVSTVESSIALHKITAT